MLEWFGEISLTESPAPYLIYIMLGGSMLIAAAGWAGQRKRTLKAAMLAVGAALTCWLILEVAWKPFPDRIPWQIYVAGAGASFVLFSAFLQRGRRRLLAALTVFAIAGAWGVFNLEFQEYPTVRSLEPRPVAAPMDYETFQSTYEAARQAPQLDGREVGALVTVDLDATQFTHRPAIAYLPPAYFTRPDLKLPVLVLMAGNPGKPQQWFDSGGAAITLDDYQATHGGISPIVVSVDGTGSMTANPICVDGPTEKVQTYLAVDVPAQLKEKFRVDPNQQRWTIGGLSYGGTCSLQIVTNAPDSYGTFLDFSGQREPTVGDHSKTVQQFFEGDEDAYQAVNPERLLEDAAGTRKYAQLQGRFIAGAKDSHAREDLSELNRKAQEAGMQSSYAEVQGGHSYQVWRVALRENLDYVAARGGLK
ncbi:alpha/beta hydrolase-fold protein [Corynebacterium sp. H128]|uniref:alpha/beta hydrolase n=1 Tax=Corynebacterium sp. H128 TaxID=3133427 RepID=UPI0030B6D000